MTLPAQLWAQVRFCLDTGQERQHVIRGGIGVLYSPHLLALFQNVISNPLVPPRLSWNRTEVASRGLKWPVYGTDLRDVVLRESGGKKSLYGIIDTRIKNPRTIQSMIDVQRAIGSTWMVSAGYVHTAAAVFHVAVLPGGIRQSDRRLPNPALGLRAGITSTARRRWSTRV